ncbi:MAG: hypothetical protein IJ397_05495 [Lachnospiraceae bacterium]|nr:hypothetical protein [Lachnospiraceae bacterium]
MTQEQINLLKEFGFQTGEDDHRGRTPIYSEKIPDLLFLEMLILTMTFQDEINYWDADWYSPTDPGGYVSALRLDNERVAYKEGNHGWTSRWYIVTIKEMAEHMQKNWDKDYDRGKFLNQVWIEPNRYTTKEKIREKISKDSKLSF